MAGQPIKFRCFQCNQLLGVSRSKAGKVVNCPKCATGLIVPEPAEVPAAGAGPITGETPALVADIDSGVPIELADIRPEDIRVQSGDNWRSFPIDTDAPRAAMAPAPPAELPPFLAPLAPAAAARSAPYDLESMPTPQVAAAAFSEARPAAARVPFPAPAAAAEPVVPPIRLEPPSLVSERTPSLRARDIVLPRTVVASWSLFVLLAQALAFVAGLLAGHYLWRVH
jgi:hypothetical protein